MEIIEKIGNTAILNAETAAKIAEFERITKELKKKEEELKKEILEEMLEKDLIKLETEELIINMVKDVTRETLDTKKLREELPDIYDAYVTIKPIKPSIRINLKGK